MNGGTLALIMAGFIAFGAGAYIAATGDRGLGITFMGVGLIFQVLSLRQLKISKKEHGDARG